MIARRTVIRVGVGLGVALVVGFGVLCALAMLPPTETEIVEVAWEWGNLAPLPTSATIIDAEAKGTMFTRHFVIRFTAPSDDIETWLAASPGPSSVDPESYAGGMREYMYHGAQGACCARITVEGDTVEVYASWS